MVELLRAGTGRISGRRARPSGGHHGAKSWPGATLSTAAGRLELEAHEGKLAARRFTLFADPSSNVGRLEALEQNRADLARFLHAHDWAAFSSW